MAFVKLDCGILRSTIWDLDPETCKVWITLLTMAGPSGLVDCHSPGVAHEARLSIESAERCLKILESPDTRSRTKSNDGRRIERTDDGYLILNYAKYRAKDHSTPRVAAFRKRHETLGNAKNGYAEAEAYTEKTKDSCPTSVGRAIYPLDFEAFYTEYPRKEGKGAALRAWKKLRESERATATEAIKRQRNWSTFSDPKYIPHPSTWLNARRWEDAPPEAARPAVQPHPARRVIPSVEETRRMLDSTPQGRPE